jgi:hypothetical protein
MASTSTQLDDDVMNILYESDECLVSRSSNTDSDIEDDIAVVDAAVDEIDSNVEERSLGDTDSNSEIIWEGMDNYDTVREPFCGNSGPQNSAVNVKDISSVFIIFLVQTPILRSYFPGREFCQHQDLAILFQGTGLN